MSEQPAAYPFEDEHDVIFLQPNCKGSGIDEDTGRMWCQDDAWGPCGCEDGCGAKSVKYIRADLNERLRMAVTALLNDVHNRYPNEELRCPFMLELESALKGGAS